MNHPQTPAELREAFRGTLPAELAEDPLVNDALDEFIEKLEDVYCGAAEFSTIEFLFGKAFYEKYVAQSAEDEEASLDDGQASLG